MQRVWAWPSCTSCTSSSSTSSRSSLFLLCSHPSNHDQSNFSTRWEKLTLCPGQTNQWVERSQIKESEGHRVSWGKRRWGIIAMEGFFFVFLLLLFCFVLSIKKFSGHHSHQTTCVLLPSNIAWCNALYWDCWLCGPLQPTGLSTGQIKSYVHSIELQSSWGWKHSPLVITGSKSCVIVW